MKKRTTSQIMASLLPRMAAWLLPLFVLVLLLRTLAATGCVNIAGCASILLVISGAGIFVYKSYPLEQPGAQWKINKEMLLSIFAVSAASWLTFYLNHTLGIGAVIASALVGLAGGLLFPKYAPPIYCGSFVGMSSRAVLPGVPACLLASLIAGIVYQTSANTLNGIGGKLGTIAFIGSVTTGIAFQLPFSSSPLPPAKIAWSIVILSVLAALLTWVIGNRLGLGAVVASALVGLAGGVVLPLLAADHGRLLAVAVFCASFTGMSSRERFSAPLVMVAGCLTGIIFILALAVFGGAGGKLGMAAFSASLAALGYAHLANRLQFAFKNRVK